MNATAIAFRDLLLNMILCLVLIIGALTIKENEEKKNSKPLGTMNVAMVWPEGPIDVDLWLNGPDQDRPTGYSNKSGVTWDLVRDDLGTSSDKLPMNFENGVSRGMPAGEYTINAHYYSGTASPVPVTFELTIQNSGREIRYTKEVTLYNKGDEVTAMHFTLDEKGFVVGEIEEDLIPLRTAPVQERDQ